MGYIHPQKDGGGLPISEDGHQGLDGQWFLDLAHESQDGYLFLRNGNRVESIKQKLGLNQVQILMLA
jgi:hypothetical protein